MSAIMPKSNQVHHINIFRWRSIFGVIETLLMRTARVIFGQTSLRVRLASFLAKGIPFLPYKWRLALRAVPRPYYGYPIFYSLKLAKSLGYKKVSIIEFGVAGGNGLVNIEYHVKEIKKVIDIEVEVYGFDLASGLPKPEDYRDLPYQWREGFYTMDIQKIQNRLEFSKLVLGDVKKSLENFRCAPIACVMFDLDYYSSTVDALKIFKCNHLPRVFCYFDDIVGCNDICLFNEYTGELLAINEFNQNQDIKLTKFRNTADFYRDTDFQDKIYVLHDFKHPQYNDYVNFEDGLGCKLSG